MMTLNKLYKIIGITVGSLTIGSGAVGALKASFGIAKLEKSAEANTRDISELKISAVRIETKLDSIKGGTTSYGAKYQSMDTSNISYRGYRNSR